MEGRIAHGTSYQYFQKNLETNTGTVTVTLSRQIVNSIWYIDWLIDWCLMPTWAKLYRGVLFKCKMNYINILLMVSVQINSPFHSV